MAETLLLRIPEPGQPARWLLLDSIGNRMGRVQSGTLAEAAVHASGRHLRVLVPGASVTLARADIPSRSLQKVLQAVPFVMEDRLAEDVETLHFAVGARADGGYAVAIVARAHMHHWLDELSAAGLVPVELVPDMLGLPVKNATMVVALDGSRVMARFPDGGGFVTDNSLAPLLLQKQLAILPEGRRCSRALIYAIDQDAARHFIDSLDDRQLEISFEPLQDDVLTLMAMTLHDGRGISLLQGAYNDHAGITEHWQRWRAAAYLLAVLCVLGIAQQGISYFQLRREAAALDAQVAAIFHTALPDVHRMVDPRAQMQQRLKRLMGGDGANGSLALLAAVGTALHDQKGILLSAFSYHAGTLQLQVQAPDADALENLKSALANNANLSVNLDSVNSTSGETSARLTVTGGGI